MARKRSKPGNAVTGQLSFEKELDALLNENPGELIKLPIKPEDVGGGLLSILSTGLYTDPLDCIREYVQNAVDAQATEVTIKITGNSVTIFDDGNGMDLADLLQARQVGLSPKSISLHVGFRGIGIYSGFDLCGQLVLRSTKIDQNAVYVLVFDFESMRAQLESDKNLPSGARKTPLLNLLSEHTKIGREPLPAGKGSQHFTVAELHDISQVHIRELSNRAKLRNYLLRNLPIDFSDTFEWKKEINEYLYAHVPGYSAITINLEFDGSEAEIVSKEVAGGLQKPKFEAIKTTASPTPIAYGWSCLNGTRGRIEKDREKGSSNNQDDPNAPEERPSYEGFVYKVKGFTIGDRQVLREGFPSKPQLYPWYTGEIYVVDPNIIPTAARNDFESNQAKRSLQLAVNKYLSELQDAVEEFREKGVADDRVTKFQEEVNRYADLLSSNTQESDYKVYSRLSQILNELKNHKNKASEDKRKIAAHIIKQAEHIQAKLEKEVDARTTEPVRKKRASKNNSIGTRSPVPQPMPPINDPPRRLLDAIRDTGLEPGDEALRVIHIFQEALDDFLGVHSSVYKNIIAYIEARLSANDEE